MNSLKEKIRKIGKYTFEVLTKYTSSGPIFLHLTMIEKQEGGGWGIPVQITYWLDTEILWFQKEVKFGEHEQFKMKVPIILLEKVIDMYVNANNIEYGTV